jgi:hypothetical protein
MRHSPLQLISRRDEVPYQGPSYNSARAQGSKENGTILTNSVLQPSFPSGHTSALESVMFLSCPFSVACNHTFRAAPSGTRPVSR